MIVFIEVVLALVVFEGFKQLLYAHLAEKRKQEAMNYIDSLVDKLEQEASRLEAKANEH